MASRFQKSKGNYIKSYTIFLDTIFIKNPVLVSNVGSNIKLFVSPLRLPASRGVSSHCHHISFGFKVKIRNGVSIVTIKIEEEKYIGRIEKTFTMERNRFTALRKTFTRILIARVHWTIHMLSDPTAIILMHALPRIVIYWITRDFLGFDIQLLPVVF